MSGRLKSTVGSRWQRLSVVDRLSAACAVDTQTCAFLVPPRAPRLQHTPQVIETDKVSDVLEEIRAVRQPGGHHCPSVDDLDSQADAVVELVRGYESVAEAKCDREFGHCFPDLLASVE